MTWDYIAGFIDGEGSIVKRQRMYNIYISQTNREVLEEIRRFTDCGSIYSIAKRRGHWKDAWLYNAGGGRNTYRILSRVIDRLVVKKALAVRVLDELGLRLKEIIRAEDLKNERIRKAKSLRLRKWSYRRIANELGTDFGYVRRLILSSK